MPGMAVGARNGSGCSERIKCQEWLWVPGTVVVARNALSARNGCGCQER